MQDLVVPAGLRGLRERERDGGKCPGGSSHVYPLRAEQNSVTWPCLMATGPANVSQPCTWEEAERGSGNGGQAPPSRLVGPRGALRKELLAAVA